MGNPLMQHEKQSVKYISVLKRCGDDVVYTNCAKGDDIVYTNCAEGDETRTVRGFINDTLRLEFHFLMDIYVK